ncbi:MULTISPECIES: hypothetical protein [Comamonas]|uniref:hypothetical protein n=1 Tax=Comamonas TaxID=283 RepID=UPI000E2D9ACC|nr:MULTISPECIES: hypothetical protein [Comamonas]RDI10737.1 hypothetical protein DFO48_105250 [Comamonas sp. AG1104]
MTRLIAFIACIAFLVGAGVSVRAGMALAAVAYGLLGAYVLWTGLQMLLGPRR